MKRIYKPMLVLAMGVLAISCKKNNEEVIPEKDYSDVLSNTGENVIVKTYEDLHLKAIKLKSASDSLEKYQTTEYLESARNSWVNTRTPWEQAEGFLFGPVDQEGIDPSIDSWPVNVTDLNNVLSSNNDITVAFLAQQEGTLKGFHTIEYLLWGDNGDKKISEFTAREFEYLSAATGVLMEDTEKLSNLWNPDKGNYIYHILNAGNGSTIYISQKSALEEMANALVVISDEVANGKINDPLSQKDLSLEESRFSNNSKNDFSNNIRSIKNIYTGYFSSYGNGLSISNVVANENVELNELILEQINDAIESIEKIPGNFSEAVLNSSEAVSEAQQKVRTLQSTLESQLLPFISNL